MLIPCANLTSTTMSTIRNPSSEGTSFKCPLCNIVHRLTTATVTISDRTLKVKAFREIFGVTAECPICLDECSKLIALPCGHILCKDDYQRMTRVMPTSTDSSRAARRALRSVDAPAAALGFRETSTGGVVPPPASDSSRSSLSSSVATSRASATTPASAGMPPAETVAGLRESEVAPHPSTSTSYDGLSSACAIICGIFKPIYISFFKDSVQTLVNVSILICFSIIWLLILLNVDDAQKLRKHALKLAFFPFLYSTMIFPFIHLAVISEDDGFIFCTALDTCIWWGHGDVRVGFKS